MRFRKVRIAWSIGCGIACVLLIALWVRSYRVGDQLQGPLRASSGIYLTSHRGVIHYARDRKLIPPIWSLAHTSSINWLSIVWVQGQNWAWNSSAQNEYLAFPHWFAVFVAAIAGVLAVPWLRWRFTLRTLLIATTLVAVVLGLIVWLR